MYMCRQICLILSSTVVTDYPSIFISPSDVELTHLFNSLYPIYNTFYVYLAVMEVLLLLLFTFSLCVSLCLVVVYLHNNEYIIHLIFTFIHLLLLISSLFIYSCRYYCINCYINIIVYYFPLFIL